MNSAAMPWSPPVKTTPSATAGAGGVRSPRLREKTSSRALDRMPDPTSVSKSLSPKKSLCLMEQPSRACGIVIFGASGDLSHRKLFTLAVSARRDKVLPEEFYIVGVARRTV